jgi:hypothetical protein
MQIKPAIHDPDTVCRIETMQESVFRDLRELQIGRAEA